LATVWQRDLPVQAPPQVKAFFALAITSVVENRKKNTFFWTDRWLLGQRLDQTYPHLFGAVAAKAKKRTVHDALDDNRWISDIRGALTIKCPN